VLKLGNYGRHIRNTWKILKFGAGEVEEKVIWTDRVRNEALHAIKEDRKSYLQWKVGRTNWIGHILRRNWHLRHDIDRSKCRVDEEEDVGNYWITLRKREDIVNWILQKSLWTWGKRENKISEYNETHYGWTGTYCVHSHRKQLFLLLVRWQQVTAVLDI